MPSYLTEVLNSPFSALESVCSVLKRAAGQSLSSLDLEREGYSGTSLRPKWPWIYVCASPLPLCSFPIYTHKDHEEPMYSVADLALD